MTWLYLALFVHLLGVIALFGSFILQQRVLQRLRTVATMGEVGPWLDLLRSTLPMQRGGVGMLLVTGLYMASRSWGLNVPWILASLGGLVALAAINLPAMTAFLRSLAAAGVQASEGPMTPALRAALLHRPTRVAMATANGLALGVLWLMATKPGAVEAIGVLIAVAAAGWLIGWQVERRSLVPSAGL